MVIDTFHEFLQWINHLNNSFMTQTKLLVLCEKSRAMLEHLKWPALPSMRKVAVGKFYIAIGKELKLKESHPDCIYPFIDRLVSVKPSIDLVVRI